MKRLLTSALTFSSVAMALPAFAADQVPTLTPRALLDQYCVGCHNDKVKTASLSVQSLDPAHVNINSEAWEKILRKVKSGQMPPAKLPRPKPPAQEAFTGWLENQLDSAAAANPNPGHPTVHRLNRAEYSNAIRDLLALDIKPGAKLPADDSGYGFDNIGDVLSISPILIERYMSVGKMISRLAVGDIARKPQSDIFDAPRTNAKAGRPERVSEDLPFDSVGGLSVTYEFSVDAEYTFHIKLPSINDAPSRVLDERFPVKAGVRTVAITFMADNAASETLPAFGLGGVAAAGQAGKRQVPAKMDLRLDGVRLKVFDVPQARFSAITISGPYNIQGHGDTPSRRQIFLCHPETAKEEAPCAAKILSNLALHAYRRPVTDAALKPLLTFYQAGRKEGDFDNGIEMALRAMLVSPEFLFRIERDPRTTATGAVYPLSDYELASRLSFFLWSSIPDDQLLQLAGQGKLREPKVLSAQVSRMLEDRKSKALISNFAGQWLYLRNLSTVKMDQDVFPKFDSSLQRAFQQETELFFTAILRENRPVMDLLSADFTFLNQRLAEHYGISGVYGSQFRRVTLTDPNRGGLLGQGSILTVTSYPNRTSVVQRGKWVLENLLGSAPPPPPPDVSLVLETHSKDGRALTMRQQMEMHRANPTCSSCHSRMDPIGFALENFDGIGAYRTKDGGSVIDASGKMPDGKVFSGASGLKSLLLNGHRDEFLTTFTEKLMTYALGRGVEAEDEPSVRAVIRDASKRNSSISDIITAIVQTQQFQMRKAKES